MLNQPTPASAIVPQLDHEGVCIVLARVRGDLEDLLASPRTPHALAPDLRDALVFVKRAAGTNYTSWAATPERRCPVCGNDPSEHDWEAHHAEQQADPTPPLIAYREDDAWEPDYDAYDLARDDPYADDGIPFELTAAGLRAAAGVA